jgi:hypothetical protein
VRLGGGAGGDQSEREREPAAQGDQLRDRLLSRSDAVRAQGGDQQGAGLGVGEDVQVQGTGAVAGEQRQEPVAT